MESMTKRYHKETGLHAHYVRNYRTPQGVPKRELTYTRKYVWWLETMIKTATNCVVCAPIAANPMEVAENTYKILSGK